MQTAGNLDLNQNGDSWIPFSELGKRVPEYRPTYPITDFISDNHAMFASCPTRQGVVIDVGIQGWLRREDALKLYELAYFAEGAILELGCGDGLSTWVLAQAVADSERRGKIVSLDNDERKVASAKGSLEARGMGELVDLRLGDAMSICEQLRREGRLFTFAFIDHSQAYEDVADVCQILPHLLCDGGWCLFHDFNDWRNATESDADYGVAPAVLTNLDSRYFSFFGIFGCTALYRHNAADIFDWRSRHRD